MALLLIGQALAGNPPDDIASQLQERLLDEVYSHQQSI